MATIFEGAIEKFAEDKGLTLLTKIDLIEELAEKLDLLDLSKTIRQYNVAVENGEDTEFEKPSNYLPSIKKDHFMSFS